MLGAAVPVGFGSAKLPTQFAAWMPGRSIPEPMQQTAAQIYAFDLLVQNSDRRPENPNLQWRDHEFAIFDHEMALVTEGVLFWQPPWISGALATQRAPQGHVLWPGLRGSHPDYSQLVDAWESIDDTRLSAYRTALPDAWFPTTEEARTVDIALGFLRDLRDNLRPAVQEIMRTLA